LKLDTLLIVKNMLTKNHALLVQICLLITGLLLFAENGFSQSEKIVVEGISIEANVVPGIMDKSIDEYLRSNLYLTFFNVLNTKIGHGLLSVYDKTTEGTYDVTMQTYSFVPYIKPINTSYIKAGLGAGISGIKFHSNIADQWGTVNVNDAPLFVNHINSTNGWYAAIEYECYLDVKVSKQFYVGWQCSYFDVMKKETIPSDFFTIGFKLKYNFNHE